MIILRQRGFARRDYEGLNKQQRDDLKERRSELARELLSKRRGAIAEAGNNAEKKVGRSLNDIKGKRMLAKFYFGKNYKDYAGGGDRFFEYNPEENSNFVMNDDNKVDWSAYDKARDYNIGNRAGTDVSGRERREIYTKAVHENRRKYGKDLEQANEDLKKYNSEYNKTRENKYKAAITNSEKKAKDARDSVLGKKNSSSSSTNNENNRNTVQNNKHEANVNSNKNTKDKVKKFIKDNKVGLGIGAAAVGTGAYLLYRHNKKKREEENKKK